MKKLPQPFPKCSSDDTTNIYLTCAEFRCDTLLTHTSGERSYFFDLLFRKFGVSLIVITIHRIIISGRGTFLRTKYCRTVMSSLIKRFSAGWAYLIGKNSSLFGMFSRVDRIRCHDKILDSVIGFITVNMVNNLKILKWAGKMFAHYNATAFNVSLSLPGIRMFGKMHIGISRNPNKGFTFFFVPMSTKIVFPVPFFRYVLSTTTLAFHKINPLLFNRIIYNNHHNILCQERLA
jgi:hypothetical protein